MTVMMVFGVVLLECDGFHLISFVCFFCDVLSHFDICLDVLILTIFLSLDDCFDRFPPSFA